MEYERYRYEQALKYLNHVKSLNDRINAKQDAIEDYRGKLACIKAMDYSADNVQVQGRGDAIPEGVARLLDMIDECTDLVCEYAKEQKRAMRVLEKLSRYEYEQVLEMHYLRGESWGAVAANTNYSYQHVMALRRSAIIELYDHIPCEYRDPMPQAM